MGKPKANTTVNTPLGKGVVTVVGEKKSEVLIQRDEEDKPGTTYRVDNDKIQ